MPDQFGRDSPNAVIYKCGYLHGHDTLYVSQSDVFSPTRNQNKLIFAYNYKNTVSVLRNRGN